jgi:fumarylacetoacetase
MNPLGPFNGKSFGTTISPWVIPLEALQPFECAAPPLDVARPAYLQDPKTGPHYAVHLQVDLFANKQSGPATVCKSRLEWLYYTFRDLVAHQTVNGCPLRPGDLLATGTVSGSEAGTLGCLLEITKGGKQPLPLPDGSSRVYLQDGDRVRLMAWAGELGSESCVGFGEAYGELLAAIDF